MSTKMLINAALRYLPGADSSLAGREVAQIPPAQVAEAWENAGGNVHGLEKVRWA